MVTQEQYSRDTTWLKNILPIAEINAALDSLQAAIESVRGEVARLQAVLDSDPGYASAKTFPAPYRFAETESGRAAADMLASATDLPIPGLSLNAADYIRRRPTGSKQKYPVRQWLLLADRLTKWVARSKKKVA